MTSSPNWTDEYREIVEFYWWEPQVIGRSKNDYHKFKSADDMWRSVSDKEVALNHVLNIFFALFPLDKLTILAVPNDARIMSSRELEQAQRQMKNATQPDFFIVGDGVSLAIELKTKSRSNLQQLEKYKFFHDYVSPKNDLRILMLTFYEEPTKVFAGDISSFDGGDLSYLSLNNFYNHLRSLKPANYSEERLLAGVTGYIDDNFPERLEKIS